MSRKVSSHQSLSKRRTHAVTFAALGDETRLALLARLSSGARLSISDLAAESALTRQAITKHLRVLERARIVRCTRAGRETFFLFAPQSLAGLQDYLAAVSEHLDGALGRLKNLVEE